MKLTEYLEFLNQISVDAVTESANTQVVISGSMRDINNIDKGKNRFLA